MVYSLNKHVLNTSRAAGSGLRAGQTAVNKSKPLLYGIYLPAQGDDEQSRKEDCEEGNYSNTGEWRVWSGRE